MIDVAQHQAVLAAMHDDSHVVIDAHRPEFRVLGLRQFVELQPGLGWIHLEVKSCGLGSFLLVTGQLGKAVCESVSDSKVHHELFLLMGRRRSYSHVARSLNAASIRKPRLFGLFSILDQLVTETVASGATKLSIILSGMKG